ncbi:MAG: hypothetical protein IIA06_07120 [Proteobacteria bacterium]|nr:hypothetical protein [Pseudomonadota bacterium]
MAKRPEDNKQDDQMFEDYLQGGSSLSGAYRAEGKARPPAHLDKAILTAANEAVRSEQSSKVAYSPFARSWYVPASMAAVLMLCVGLVFTIYKDSGQILLTPPKSEYDFDAQVAPMKSDESREKNRQYKYTEEITEEGEMSMGLISEENRPAASLIEAFDMEESDILQKPASKQPLREKTVGRDDVSAPAMASDMASEIESKKYVPKYKISDSDHLPDRQNISESLRAADVKKQKQGNVGDLDNKIGEMELKANEEEADTATGTTSVQDSRYRRALDGLQRRDESLKGETLDNYKASTGYEVPEKLISGKSIGDEMMTPDQWLEQINELWLSGDHSAADENLKQFFNVFPEYPVEKIKSILDPQINFMKYINILR